MEIKIEGQDLQDAMQVAIRKSLADTLGGYKIQTEVQQAVAEWLAGQDFAGRVARSIAQHAEPELDAAIEQAARDAVAGLGVMCRVMMRQQLVTMIYAMRHGDRYLDAAGKAAAMRNIEAELLGVSVRHDDRSPEVPG